MLFGQAMHETCVPFKYRMRRLQNSIVDDKVVGRQTGNELLQTLI